MLTGNLFEVSFVFYYLVRLLFLKNTSRNTGMLSEFTDNAR